MGRTVTVAAAWLLLATALLFPKIFAKDMDFEPVLKHEVLSLPGFDGDELPSRHFTGHIPVNQGDNMLFYWLVESEYSAADDPVMLWLTGGPGCSSMDALVYEHGPFNFNFTSHGLGEEEGNVQASNRKPSVRLTPNRYSWSKATTIIYVDSPVGVGMSYSRKENEIYTDDQQTTDDLLEFIATLLTSVHPRLLSKDFYIAGESYAGVYVPLLASKVMKRNQLVTANEQINLQGYAVGNGVADDMYDGNGQPEFAINLGLIDPTTYGQLVDVCGGVNSFWNATPGDPCDKEIRAAYDRFYWLNPYDILQDCYSPRDNHNYGEDDDAAAAPQKGTFDHALSSASRRLAAQRLTQGKGLDQPGLKAAGRKGREGRDGRKGQDGKQRSEGWRGGKGAVPPALSTLRASAGAGALGWPLAGVRGGVGGTARHWGGMLGYSVPCADRRVAMHWLNLPEVRRALHAPPLDRLEWQPCSEHMHYHMVPLSMLPLHKQALDQGLRVLIYSGDHDFVVPFTGTRAWVYSLNLTISEPYAPWMIDGQVAGFRVKFSEGLEFLTVKGGGHMVPQSSPDRALHLISRYLGSI